MANNPNVDPGAAEDDRRLRYDAGTGYGATHRITKGDCRAMSIYGVGLMPLASHMRETIPEAL
ncbi:hypothetical protein ACHAXR_001183 [Thalassiosira sp. AJA248-18]